jgi:hypothetical protein
MMKQVGTHYKSYPETPEGFEKWRSKTQNMFKEARAKMQ